MSTPPSIAIPDAAADLAAVGFNIFPIAAGAKDRPLIRWRHGATPATSDSAQVRVWWTRWPLANIGIATGAGVAVVDVDPRSGGTVEYVHDVLGLPPTLTARTPSDGRHLYYAVDGPVRNSASHLGAGIDVRGDGGMVVAPPSIITGRGEYAWTDLRPLATVEAARLHGNPYRRTRTGMAKTFGDPFEYRDHVSAGGRHDYLTRFAGLHRRHYAEVGSAHLENDLMADLIGENAHACFPPLDENEVLAIARWAARLPV